MKRTMNHTVARRMSRALAAGAAWAAFGFAGTAAFAQPATPAAASGPAAAPAAQSADAALIKRGEYLARAGDCIACHTASGGKPFAGGLKFDTPIGGIYSTNITPDPKTAWAAGPSRTSRARCAKACARTATRCIQRCRSRPTRA